MLTNWENEKKGENKSKIETYVHKRNEEISKYFKEMGINWNIGVKIGEE